MVRMLKEIKLMIDPYPSIRRIGEGKLKRKNFSLVS